MQPGSIPSFLSGLLRYYFFNLVLLSVLRLALYMSAGGAMGTEHLGTSFLFGLQYDSVVLAYILALPFLLLSILDFSGKEIMALRKFSILYLLLCNVVLVFLGIADIPYFLFFTNRLSEVSFQWLSTPATIFEMLVSDPKYGWLLLFAVLFTIAYTLFIRKQIKPYLLMPPMPIALPKRVVFFVVGLGIIFLGLRGRLDHPIRVGDAFHTDNELLNQLGLNPLFVIMKSLDSKVKLMEDEQALKLVNEQLGLKETLPFSPIARYIPGKDSISQPNMVLVLMEGMSADYLGAFGNKENLTPNLDSLYRHSLAFTNAYSAGIHTNNGIFSTLYGFPAIKGVRPMSVTPTRVYSGLPGILKAKGYQNYFFTSHDQTFDNLAGFLPKNHIDRLYHAGDYPDSLELGPFGVPDDYLFDFVIKELNQKQGGTPFFASVLTTSNHGPYLLPDYFKSSRNAANEKAVQYADWSIGKFMEAAAREAWFKNTIFIFIADHGLAIKEWPYGINLSYNHIPFFIHAPYLGIAPRLSGNWVGQIDVFPTLMGILGYSYLNNTLGVDVLQHHRSEVYFSADDKLACMNDKGLFVYHYSGKEFYYPFVDDSGAETNAKQLKNAAFSSTQVSQWMFSHDKTAIP